MKNRFFEIKLLKQKLKNFFSEIFLFIDTTFRKLIFTLSIEIKILFQK